MWWQCVPSVKRSKDNYFSKQGFQNSILCSSWYNEYFTIVFSSNFVRTFLTFASSSFIIVNATNNNFLISFLCLISRKINFFNITSLYSSSTRFYSIWQFLQDFIFILQCIYSFFAVVIFLHLKLVILESSVNPFFIIALDA